MVLRCLHRDRQWDSPGVVHLCARGAFQDTYARTSVTQVEDNMGALNYISKIDSVRDKIEAIMQNKPEPVLQRY